MRRLLDEAGIATIDADSIGHQMLEPDGAAFDEVAEKWPDVVVDGRISRPTLAAVVFNDSDQLSALEAITHPLIFEEIRHQIEGVSLVVVEMPILGKELEGVWQRMVVDCRDGVRLERAVARGMDPTDARTRLALQPSRSEWLAAAHLVIPNHGGPDDVASSVGGLVLAIGQG